MPNPRIRPPRVTSRSESSKRVSSDVETRKIKVFAQLTPLDQSDDSIRHAIINQLRKYRGVYVRIKRDPSSNVHNDRIAVFEFNDTDACNYFKQAILERRDRIVVFDKILFFDFAHANRQMQDDRPYNVNSHNNPRYSRNSPRNFNNRRSNRERSPINRFPRPPLAPSRTLFIGNLDENDTATELRKYFEPYGELLEIVVKQPSHHGTSPYAFIKYKTMDASLNAKEKIQDTFVGGRRVKIGFGKVTATHAVWAGGFEKDISEEELVELLKPLANFVTHSFDKADSMCYFIFQTLEESRRAFHEFSSVKVPGLEHGLQVDFADTLSEVKHLMEGVEIQDGKIRRDSISSKDSSGNLGSERSKNLAGPVRRSSSPESPDGRIPTKRKRSVSVSSTSSDDSRRKISSHRDLESRNSKNEGNRSFNVSMDVSPIISTLMDIKEIRNSPYNYKHGNNSDFSPELRRTRIVKRAPRESKHTPNREVKTRNARVGKRNRPALSRSVESNSGLNAPIGLESDRRRSGRHGSDTNYLVHGVPNINGSVFQSPSLNTMVPAIMGSDACPYFPQILSSYPVGWRGKVVVKNSSFLIRMYIVCGNVEVVSTIVHQATLSGIDPTSINLEKRFQLLPDRIIELRSKFANAIASRDCCVLVAQQQDPPDRKDDSKNHSNSTSKPISSLITYFHQKQAAGIGSIGASSIYMFPPSQFTYEQLTTLMPHAVSAISNSLENYLMVMVSR